MSTTEPTRLELIGVSIGASAQATVPGLPEPNLLVVTRQFGAFVAELHVQRTKIRCYLGINGPAACSKWKARVDAVLVLQRVPGGCLATAMPQPSHPARTTKDLVIEELAKGPSPPRLIAQALGVPTSRVRQTLVRLQASKGWVEPIDRWLTQTGGKPARYWRLTDEQENTCDDAS